MLRVALVTGNYDTVVDGVSLTTHRLAGFLERSGVAVKVFAPAGDRPALARWGELVGVPSVPLPCTGGYRLALGLPPSARRELRHFAPTLVHLHTPDLLGFAALRWARLHAVPAVATYHTHFAGYLKYYRAGFLSPAVWAWTRWFYRRCAEVYVPAPSVAAELRARGVRAEFVDAPFGVDADRFHPGRRSSEWRRALGIADDEVVVAFVGRLVWEKGLALFADVLTDLKTNGVGFRALVAGDGPARDALRARMPGAVFTGFLDPGAVPTALASSDVFFYPSATETFGCVTLEAMASGLPVVVADAPGSRDIVRNGVDGIVVRAEDRGGFALTVRRLVENPAARESLGRAALRRAADYRWDALLADVLENYHRVLRRWPLRSRR